MLKDFDIFSRALIASKDVDPTYPAVKKIIELEGFEPEWFIFTYVSFYNLESAIKMCRVFPEIKDYNSRMFFDLRNTKCNKFGHERRGTQRTYETMNDFFTYLVAVLGDARFKNFVSGSTNLEFRGFIERLPNHGSWAAFKIAELFEKSLDYNNLHIQDLGLSGRDPNSNDGPIGGLRWLYSRDFVYDNNWFTTWNDFGSKLAKYWSVDIGEVETCLCKFHKQVSGKYYIGHDVVELCELKQTLGDVKYKAVMNLFDDELWQGKHGVEKHLKPIYKNTGKILNSHYSERFEECDIAKIILDDKIFQL